MIRDFNIGLRDIFGKISKEEKNKYGETLKWLIEHISLSGSSKKEEKELSYSIMIIFLEILRIYPNEKNAFYLECMQGSIACEIAWCESDEVIQQYGYIGGLEYIKEYSKQVLTELMGQHHLIKHEHVIQSIEEHYNSIYFYDYIEEILETIPEQELGFLDVYNFFFFLSHIFMISTEQIQQNILYVLMNEKNLDKREQLSYVYGMCFYDFVVSKNVTQVLLKKTLEKMIYISYKRSEQLARDVLIDEYVKLGIDTKVLHFKDNKKLIKEIDSGGNYGRK